MKLHMGRGCSWNVLDLIPEGMGSLRRISVTDNDGYMNLYM